MTEKQQIERRRECLLHADMADDIKTMFGLIGQMVTWKVFTFIALLAVGVIGAGFGYFGTELKSQRIEQAACNKEFASLLQNMATTQAVMMVKISNLEKQQESVK
jgi:hypothetical protein